MQTKTLLVGAFAVVFGIVSAVGAFISQRNSQGVTETVALVTAGGELSRGTLLTAEHLTLTKFPASSVPPSAIREVEKAIGRTVKDPLAKGELLLENRLTELGVGRGLPPLIPKGMRAVSIPTSNISSGVTGFVMPNNKVDVLLTMHGHGGQQDPTGGGRTITLLQNVTVLAVDQKIEAPTEQKMDLKEMKSEARFWTLCYEGRMRLMSLVFVSWRLLSSPMPLPLSREMFLSTCSRRFGQSWQGCLTVLMCILNAHT